MKDVRYLSVKLQHVENEPFDFDEMALFKRMRDKLNKIISGTDIKFRLMIYDDQGIIPYVHLEFAAADGIDTSQIVEIRRYINEVVTTIFCVGGFINDQWTTSLEFHDVQPNNDTEIAFYRIDILEDCISGERDYRVVALN